MPSLTTSLLIAAAVLVVIVGVIAFLVIRAAWQFADALDDDFEAIDCGGCAPPVYVERQGGGEGFHDGSTAR